jgi:ribosomal-protein-alanine N-acetyltransferase
MMALERLAPTAAHWTPAEYDRIFTPGQTPRVALVAEEGGEVRGFLVARALGPDWELENIAVAGSARRRGGGARLVREFLELARSRGAARVYLEVRESNLPARALYASCAFEEVGRRKSYYQNPIEDALIYQFTFATPPEQ